MFATLIEKELKAILLSPKFVATFGVCAILILLSVFIGIQEYQASVKQYETAQQLLDQEVREATSWWGLANKAYRAPDPMQIFASGVNNDVGRFSNISSWSEVKLRQSAYADNPLFALFRFIDFTFIVQVVLSLFAILFTYDAINGERENGTLKLAFSNAVPRAQFVAAKFIGSWLGLTLPILIPVLLGVLLVMVLNVPMTGADWSKVGMLVGASVLYFTFFIALGLLVSSLTKRSSVSFLVLLVAWVVIVLIVPRSGAMLAGQVVPVPSIAEIESQMDRFSKDRRRTYYEGMGTRWQERMEPVADKTDDEKRQYRQDNQEDWDAEEQELQDAMESDIAEFNRKLQEDLRNQKANQEQLAFVLSRFSPSSSYQLTAMNLGGTNTSLKQRYENAMAIYRDDYNAFVQVKREEERERRREEQKKKGSGGFMMFFGGGSGDPIDATEMPQFVAPEETVAEALEPSVVDVGLLGLYVLLAFAGAFVAFLHYDVR